MIDAAERRETSCSPDRPPYTTPTRSLRSVMVILRRSLCGAARSAATPGSSPCRGPDEPLFVGDPRARRAGQWNHFRATEAHGPAPSEEVGCREVERIAEFDQHVEGHHESEDVPAACVGA